MTTYHPTMAWTNQRYTSNDCINLKALWKMLILDDNHAKEQNVSTTYLKQSKKKRFTSYINMNADRNTVLCKFNKKFALHRVYVAKMEKI